MVLNVALRAQRRFGLGRLAAQLGGQAAYRNSPQTAHIALANVKTFRHR
jgi:hypothetical protein